jgi:hypothetical protein
LRGFELADAIRSSGKVNGLVGGLFGEHNTAVVAALVSLLLKTF